MLHAWNLCKHVNIYIESMRWVGSEDSGQITCWCSAEVGVLRPTGPSICSSFVSKCQQQQKTADSDLHALFKIPLLWQWGCLLHSQPYRHRDAPLSVSWRKSVWSAVGWINQTHQLQGCSPLAWWSCYCRRAQTLHCKGVVFLPAC